MKKLISYFVTSLFVLFISSPIFLMVHNSAHMGHDMVGENCVEHCIGSENYNQSGVQVIVQTFGEVLSILILHGTLTVFVLPLILLYLLGMYKPPDMNRSIKNYSYSKLIGIIQANT